MVEKTVKRMRRLTAAYHDEIRHMVFLGWSMGAVSDRTGFDRATISHHVKAHHLDAPIGQIEAVKLAVLAAFRDTNKRLADENLDASEHAKLCMTQMRQAELLQRFGEEVGQKKGADMSTEQDNAGSRYRAMSREELQDELKRLVDLETKSEDAGNAGQSDHGATGSHAGEQVSRQSEHGPAPANTG